ncbi:MAG: hypothetical protein KC434_03745 [Anaerolineales bacterium]|nr:hypothetical protein [Anaerolineales bacterium]
MAAKLLMRWDVRPETESEYFEFLVHEFIPGLNKLGISDIQVWYTQYGECEQKLASGIANTTEKMQEALHSAGWHQLNDRLQQYVDNFSQKVIPATGGFQI